MKDGVVTGFSVLEAPDSISGNRPMNRRNPDEISRFSHASMEEFI
jgi:hypothetical protein